MIYDQVAQEREDGSTKRHTSGVKMVALQNDFCSRVCGNEFGGKVDAGVVLYGLMCVRERGIDWRS